MTIANKVSRFNRARKWKTFNKLLEPSAGTTILDVGFNEEEYTPVDNFFEKNYPYPHNITALGMDSPQKFLKRYPLVKAIKYDGKIFPFADKEFDICWSNAVLEHVGNTDAQILFLKEIKRVAKRAFISTPNKFFPIEVHTKIPLLHFLPKRMFDKILVCTGKKWAAGNYMNLLSLKELKCQLRKAEISNYRIIKNKLLFFTLDFVIYLE